MSDDIKLKFGLQRNRSYLNRDFGDFRGELLRYANIYFKDKIQDFSEASMGGLFLDMAAYVGDTMSFYLDHQFRELSPDTVSEAANLEAMIRNAGLQIRGDSPASVTVNFYLEIPAVIDPVTGETIPDPNSLPTIKDGARLISSSGISFYLTESIDFSDQTSNGRYSAQVTPLINSAGTITSYVFMRQGLAVSGTIETETFSISSTFVPFRTIKLSKQHVSSILRVFDSEGNDYHQVESLSQDTVFRKNRLSNGDTSIEVINTPYRYILDTAVSDRTSIIRFGSGDGSNINDVKIPNPSDMALPLYGKETFAKISLDPNQLLQSTSLGVSPTNTTITVVYRHGGGANHNVEADTIREVMEVEYTFLQSLSYNTSQAIKASLAVKNDQPARGGARAPSLVELKNFVTSARSMQNRIVTTDDLLARIYTLPTEFGVVHRANVLPNPENALSSILHVISQDSQGRLVPCSDALKRNLSTYLNEFRLIGDAMDVLDAEVINFKINIECRFSHTVNKYELISLIIAEVQKLFTRDKGALGKPIVVSEIRSVVQMLTGVISVVSVELTNIHSTVQNREYSASRKDLLSILDNDIYFFEPYEIAELRYPNQDILVTVI